MEPMLLCPVGKDYLWGGIRLKTEYNKTIPAEPLAETWECSAHPDGSSVVVNGEFAGQTLEKVLHSHPEFLGVRVDKRYGLPVLVKLIDAKKDLSIQVHPDDRFARKIENDFGKTEMWYVLEADESASLICGFAHDVNKDMLRRLIAAGTLDKHLNRVKVHKGDVFLIPAGTVHGIGAGCVLAEIQESSNVTYRLYDYNRKDKNGAERELHFEKAVQVLNMKTGQCYRQSARQVQYYPDYRREMLCRCRFFETLRITVRRRMEFTVDSSSFQVLLCIQGNGSLKNKAEEKMLRLQKGDCIFLPAGIGNCSVTGECELLEVHV